jgi:hypothetical protein
MIGQQKQSRTTQADNLPETNGQSAAAISANGDLRIPLSFFVRPHGKASLSNSPHLTARQLKGNAHTQKKRKPKAKHQHASHQAPRHTAPAPNRK